MKRVFLTLIATAMTLGAIGTAYADDHDHHHRECHKVKVHHHWEKHCH